MVIRETPNNGFVLEDITNADIRWLINQPQHFWDTVMSYHPKTIGRCAFYRKFDLKQIDIPEGITTIGDYAFSKCCGLVKVNLPKSIKYIGKGAFEDCSSLVLINIPKNAILKDDVFNGCTKLKDFNALTSFSQLE